MTPRSREADIRAIRTPSTRKRTLIGDFWEQRVDPTRLDENQFVRQLLAGTRVNATNNHVDSLSHYTHQMNGN